MLTRMLNLLLKEHNEMEKTINLITRVRDLDTIVKQFFNHAIDEERVMQEVGYSDFTRHKHEHQIVIIRLRDFSITPETDLLELRQTIYGLIFEHISKWDMPLLNGLEMEHVSRNQSGNESMAP